MEGDKDYPAQEAQDAKRLAGWNTKEAAKKTALA